MIEKKGIYRKRSKVERIQRIEKERERERERETDFNPLLNNTHTHTHRARTGGVNKAKK